ncbi:olfactory receptor 51G2-like [Mergus octosetaceus]
MSPGNSSHVLAFLLAGIPGMARFHRWVFIPFGLMYLIAMLGNGIILLVVRAHHSLHEPMYYFLSMLATTDLGLTLSTLPTVLCVFWFHTREISFPVCLAQMFFIHAFSFMESSVLLAMAFDRYVAVCFPLRSHVLSHPYCLHQDMIQLACTDATLNSLYGLTLVSMVILDSLLIVFSYAMIIRAVLGITSREEQARALNTCVAHFCAVLIFYIPLAGLSIIHRYGKNAAPISHALMANVYLFVPPVLNPILYSMKNKAIRRGLLRLLCQRAPWPGHGWRR